VVIAAVPVAAELEFHRTILALWVVYHEKKSVKVSPGW